jgi:hypothetical protein
VDGVYQAAVALFYLEDCSYKEIGAVLGVPIGTVKSRIARGIAQLREILLSDGCGEPTTKADGIPAGMNTDVTAPMPGNPILVSPQRSRLAVGTVERSYAEWVFSSSRLRELPGSV